MCDKENDMSVRDKTRWREWAERLRQEMMSALTPQVTKSVDTITEEIGTDKSPSVLHSSRFWSSCQTAQGTNDTLVKAAPITEVIAADHITIPNSL